MSGSQHLLSKRSWSYLGHTFSTRFLFSFLLPTVNTGLVTRRANCLAETLGGRGVGMLLGFRGLLLVRYDFCLFVQFLFLYIKGFILNGLRIGEATGPGWAWLLTRTSSGRGWLIRN